MPPAFLNWRVASRPLLARGRRSLRFVAGLLGLSLLCITIGCRATEPQPLEATHSWRGALSDQPLPFSILEPVRVITNTPLPVVIYLKNLACPRVGTERDDTILHELRSSGYLVAILDYVGRTNARVPFLNRDLGKMRDDIRAKTLLGDHNVDMAHVFIVPEGCRLKRDVAFYRDDGRTLAMDIIYPSNPKRAVGALLEFSCDNKDRFGNTSLSICSDTLLDGFATEGFAVAMADHPVAPPYKGLDPMPECAWKIKAAVRSLRAEGERFGLNGNIVPVGFSRGSGMALMLVTTEGLAEFDGHGENLGVKSDVQGGVVMSGRFTYLDLLPEDKMLPRYAKAWGDLETGREVWRRHGALDYLTRATMPLFLTINCTEAPEALHQMEILRERLAKLGVEAAFHLDNETRGHKVTLDSKILATMTGYLRRQLDGPKAVPSQ